LYNVQRKPMQTDCPSPPAKRLLLATILPLLVIGCAAPQPLSLKLQRDLVIPPRSVVVFFVDGLRVDTMRQMAADGDLPNIRKYLLDAGTEVQYAISSIPTITYANTVSISTGLFPGHHHIMGNAWFDPYQARFQDYKLIRTYQQVDDDLQRMTLYGLLNDKFTVTIQTANRRGATRPIDNWASSGINWFFGRILQVDELVADRFKVIAQTANQAGRWPDYIVAYFPALDEIGHRQGSDSSQYRQAMQNVDRQIGRICKALHEKELLDHTYRILISDHGHVPAERRRYWRPDEFLSKQLGIKTVSQLSAEGQPYGQRAKFFDQFRAVVANGGYRRAHIHLRGGPHWFQPADYTTVLSFVKRFGHPADKRFLEKDLPSILAEIPAVRLVAVKVDDRTVELLHQGRKARIIRRIDRGKSYGYGILAGGDPLGYVDDPDAKSLIESGFHSADTWLAATCDTDFPDLVPQIVELFDSPRAGQIVIFADRGWDFHQNDVGGHGSVLAEDMLVPLVLAGPGIEAGGKLRTARLVDLMPTVVDMLGCSDRLAQCGPLDGKSLLPVLLQAQNEK